MTQNRTSSNQHGWLRGSRGVLLLAGLSVVFLIGVSRKLTPSSSDPEGHVTPPVEQATSRKISESIKRQPQSSVIAQTFTPPLHRVEEAKQRLAVAYAVQNVQERRRLCSEIIVKLCRSGFVEEAFELISPTPGFVRQGQIDGFFRNCGLDLGEAAEKIEQLEFAMDALHAGKGYLAAYSGANDLVSLVDSPEFGKIIPLIQQDLPPQSNALRAVLSGVLLEGAMASATAEEATPWLETGAVLRDLGKIEDPDLAEAVAYARNMDPLNRWNFFSENFSGPSSNADVNKSRTYIVDKMIEANAEAAVDSITAVHTDQGALALGEAVKSWHRNDPTAVEQWYHEERTNLTSNQQDVVSEAYFKLALNFSDLDAAAAWADEVGNADLKQKLLEELAKSHS